MPQSNEFLPFMVGYFPELFAIAWNNLQNILERIFCFRLHPSSHFPNFTELLLKGYVQNYTFLIHYAQIYPRTK